MMNIPRSRFSVSEPVRSSRRGIAMLLVVVLVAVVTLMSVAMLSSSALRAQTGSTASDSATAAALAESGVNLAMYYLQNPAQAPALNSSGYWPGASALEMGLGGTTDVAVTRLSSNHYEVMATGRTPSGLERGVRARVRVNLGFHVQHAAGFRLLNTLIDRNTRIMGGDVQADGLLTVNGRIDQTAVAPAFQILLFGHIGNAVLSILPRPAIVPTAGQLNDYRTYTYNGQTYEAVLVPGNLNQKNLGPTPNNPAGIFWAAGDLRLPSDVVVHGTLLIPNGNLLVHSGGNTITPVSGFPAVIVGGNLVLENPAKSIDVNGLCWIGGSLTRVGPNNACIMTIRGALLMAGTGAVIGPNQSGRITVQFNPGNAWAPELTNAVSQAPHSVSLLEWQPQ